MKPFNSSGMSLGMLAVGIALASCAATKPVATPTTDANVVQPTGLAATSARPEFPGFTLVIRQGIEFYCQKRNLTGSRARVVEVCHSREEMLHMAENKDEYFKQIGDSGSHDALRTDSPN